MKTLRLTSSRRPDVRRAAGLLRRGKIVAFATETVYGLGADAFNPKAVLRVFHAKRRPTFDPLIVHLGNRLQLKSVAAEVNPLARSLARAFWPGPLTILFPKTDAVPDLVTAGLSTVAVRIPAHPCARQLLNDFGGPVAAPSANRFGYTSPTSADDVAEDLLGRVDAILDGGPSTVGIESTIVWPHGKEIIVLRPGAVSVEALSRFGRVKVRPHRPGEVLSPGGLPTHYAPQTPMALLSAGWRKECERLSMWLGSKPLRAGLLLFKEERFECPPVRAVWVLSRKGNSDEAASNLFRAIRNLDKMSLDVILAGPVPRSGIGLAISDRLEKAASGRRAGADFYKTLFK